MINIHASCVSLNQKGILLLGKSGAGKSDTAFRLIEQLGAVLVADDRTDLTTRDGNLYASCPQQIKGLLEVRGIGIVKQPCMDNVQIKLAVELVKSPAEIERLPIVEYEEFETIKIRKIKIFPFEASAVYKIRLACDENEQAG